MAQPHWDSPAIGVWTVRDLAGHTDRAPATVETYRAKSAGQVDIQRPVDYFLRATGTLAEPGAVAERGRQAGRGLGRDPAAKERETAAVGDLRVARPMDR